MFLSTAKDKQRTKKDKNGEKPTKTNKIQRIPTKKQRQKRILIQQKTMYNEYEVIKMEPIKMVVICKNENWCEQLNKQILNYPTLIVSEIISDYKDLDRAMSQHMPEILISDLDLLISTGYKYEFIAERTMS